MSTVFFYENYLTLIGIPLLAALIGWITNVVAIKMLFHPKKPINLGVMVLHGVFPKRQQQFAEKLGNLVATELLSSNDINLRLKELATNPDFQDELLQRLSGILVNKLPVAVPMLAMFLNQEMVSSILIQIKPDIGEMLASLVDSLANKLETSLDVQVLVQEKVKAFSSEKLEEVLHAIMKREFKEVELLGGVLGFFIGLVQVALQFI